MKVCAATTNFAVMIVFLLAGCAATGVWEPLDQTKSDGWRRGVVEPTQMFEHCLLLDEGEKMRYSFRAEKPLGFYIHYHEHEKFVRDQQEGERDFEGTFTSDRKRIYCLTWTNRHERRVYLVFSYDVIKE